MWTILSKFWPHIIAGLIIAGLVALILHWKSEADRVKGLENELEVLQGNYDDLEADCARGKKITTEIGEEYEEGRINADSDDRRLRDEAPACIEVSRGPDTTNNTDKQNKSRSSNVSSAKLFDFARECETDRLKVIGWQRYYQQIKGK